MNVARRSDVIGSSRADARQQLRSLSAESHRRNAFRITCLLSRPQKSYSVCFRLLDYSFSRTAESSECLNVIEFATIESWAR